ncbi:MAG: type II CAAX prenyl endopeptidase Rce1 family protein [Acidobacteriota bacterium]
MSQLVAVSAMMPTDTHLPRPGQGTRLLFIVFVLLLSLGAAAQEWSVIPGLLFTEIALLLAPALLACRLHGIRPAVILGRRLAGREAWDPLLAGAGIGGLAFGMAVGLTVPLVLIFLFLGGHHPGLPLPLQGGNDYAWALLSGAVVAPFCEEVFFRGFLLASLRTHGAHLAVWVTAVCFGLFHMDPVRFLPTMALGVVFGELTLATGSVLPAVAAHSVNNLVALSLAHLAGRAGGAQADMMSWESFRDEVARQIGASGSLLAGWDPEAMALLALVATSALCLLAGLTLAVLIWLCLNGLRRRLGGRWETMLPGRPAGLLLRDPWLWGVLAVGLLVWGLQMVRLFGNPAAGG